MMPFAKKSWVWSINEDKAIDEQKLLDRKVRVKDDSGIEKTIVVKEVKTNLSHLYGKHADKEPAPKLQVMDANGDWYLISYVRAFSAIQDDEIDEKEILEFEKLIDSTRFHVEPPKKPKSKGPWWKNKNLWLPKRN
jgi:hypothetical protein